MATGYCVISHPSFISKHFFKLIKNLQRKDVGDSVKRNTVRLLQYVEVPKKFHGELMNICFNYVTSTTEPVAVKVFSLTILHNLSQKYPEIRQELKLVIEERWNYETAAFHSRAKKILNS